MSAVLSIDKSRVKRSFASAVGSYDEMAGLQRKVGMQLLQQISAESRCDQIVDIGCGTGFLTQQLIALPLIEQVFAIDIALSMVQRTREKLESSKNIQYICADAEFIPLKNQSVDMIVSNLALQWCQNLTAVFNGFKNMLKTEGCVLFSSFGPATLQELKQAWAKVDNYSHVNDFYSADEIYSFLEQSGYEDIKIVTKDYQSSYSSVIGLMRELKGIGAHNILANRNRNMTRKTDMQSMISAYEQNRINGMIPATYQIIFVSARVK